MSKALRLVYLIIVTTLLGGVTAAQDIEATITADLRGPVVSISGRTKSPLIERRHLAFERGAIGTDRLASRISDLRITNRAGQPVAFRKLMDGEFLADADFENWSYKVDLTPVGSRSTVVHASWFADGVGILMLRDLLPQYSDVSAKITFLIPGDRLSTMPLIHSGEVKDGDSYKVEDVENAVFYVGDKWQPQTAVSAAPALLSGTWNFGAEDIAAMITEIVGHYTRVLGPLQKNREPFIAIGKFPGTVPHGNWEAETRGRNVTIISSDMPFRTQSLQRLHEQLRHELFHLWIPNSVKLTGNYDWFYEGFALYQSLKLAVAVNRIRFEDFLDTLSRAHTIDSAIPQKVSLIEASKSRLSGANTQTYARGMLIAFLCDVALLQESKGKRSVENALRTVYHNHRPPAGEVDGNEAIVALLKLNKAVVPIVDKYVSGVERIDWTGQLSAAGVEDRDPGPTTALRVVDKPSGRQKTLLDRLGYNNWRRLSQNSK